MIGWDLLGLEYNCIESDWIDWRGIGLATGGV